MPKKPTPKVTHRCAECDAPVSSQGVYEGGILGNLDDITTDDRNSVIGTLTTLALYCALRNQAENQRIRGDAHSAKEAEDQCDRLYKTLPRWIRW